MELFSYQSYSTPQLGHLTDNRDAFHISHVLIRPAYCIYGRSLYMTFSHDRVVKWELLKVERQETCTSEEGKENGQKNGAPTANNLRT